MQISFLSALFLISRVMADAPPATPTNPTPPATTPPSTTPNTGTGNNGNAADPSKTEPTLPPPIAVQCTNTFFTFSELDLAQMEQQSQSNPVNTTSLSTAKEAAICQNADINALCKTSTCSTIYPSCSTCHKFTPVGDGPQVKIDPAIVARLNCTSTYFFNKTNTVTPFICSNTETEQFSCESCIGSTSCSECYNEKDLPNA